MAVCFHRLQRSRKKASGGQRELSKDASLKARRVDGTFEARPAAHIWRSDASDWYDPKSELPELPEGV